MGSGFCSRSGLVHKRVVAVGIVWKGWDSVSVVANGALDLALVRAWRTNSSSLYGLARRVGILFRWSAIGHWIGLSRSGLAHKSIVATGLEGLGLWFGGRPESAGEPQRAPESPRESQSPSEFQRVP